MRQVQVSGRRIYFFGALGGVLFGYELQPAGSGDGGRFTRKPASDRTPARPAS